MNGSRERRNRGPHGVVGSQMGPAGGAVLLVGKAEHKVRDQDGQRRRGWPWQANAFGQSGSLYGPGVNTSWIRSPAP
jgi:hypothetical protein